MPTIFSREQIDRLYQQYRGDVYRYSLFLTHNADEAEDITQDVFLKIVSGCSYEERSNQKGWILVITKHAAMDRLALNMRTVPVGDDIGLFEGENPFAGLAVYEWIHCLDKEEQELIILHIVYGLKHKEAAAIVGKSAAAVRKQYQRAIQKLRQIMI